MSTDIVELKHSDGSRPYLAKYKKINAAPGFAVNTPPVQIATADFFDGTNVELVQAATMMTFSSLFQNIPVINLAGPSERGQKQFVEAWTFEQKIEDLYTIDLKPLKGFREDVKELNQLKSGIATLQTSSQDIKKGVVYFTGVSSWATETKHAKSFNVLFGLLAKLKPRAIFFDTFTPESLELVNANSDDTLANITLYMPPIPDKVRVPKFQEDIILELAKAGTTINSSTITPFVLQLDTVITEMTGSSSDFNFGLDMVELRRFAKETAEFIVLNMQFKQSNGGTECTFGGKNGTQCDIKTTGHDFVVPKNVDLMKRYVKSMMEVALKRIKKHSDQTLASEWTRRSQRVVKSHTFTEVPADIYPAPAAPATSPPPGSSGAPASDLADRDY